MFIKGTMLTGAVPFSLRWGMKELRTTEAKAALLFDRIARLHTDRWTLYCGGPNSFFTVGYIWTERAENMDPGAYKLWNKHDPVVMAELKDNEGEVNHWIVINWSLETLNMIDIRVFSAYEKKPIWKITDCGIGADDK